ncbi:MAG: hypothetical protein ABIQ86_05085 [Steroidobacteraceae bacterium]
MSEHVKCIVVHGLNIGQTRDGEYTIVRFTDGDDAVCIAVPANGGVTHLVEQLLRFAVDTRASQLMDEASGKPHFTEEGFRTEKSPHVHLIDNCDVRRTEVSRVADLRTDTGEILPCVLEPDVAQQLAAALTQACAPPPRYNA